MNRPSVDPAFSFGVALIVSLVLWYPTLHETLHGNIDITDAGIRWFLALAISWAGVYGICALVAMYASQPRAPRPPGGGGGAEQSPQRRRDDAPVPGAPEEAATTEPNAA